MFHDQQAALDVSVALAQPPMRPREMTPSMPYGADVSAVELHVKARSRSVRGMMLCGAFHGCSQSSTIGASGSGGSLSHPRKGDGSRRGASSRQRNDYMHRILSGYRSVGDFCAVVTGEGVRRQDTAYSTARALPAIIHDFNPMFLRSGTGPAGNREMSEY